MRTALLALALAEQADDAVRATYAVREAEPLGDLEQLREAARTARD